MACEGMVGGHWALKWRRAWALGRWRQVAAGGRLTELAALRALAISISCLIDLQLGGRRQQSTSSDGAVGGLCWASDCVEIT